MILLVLAIGFYLRIVLEEAVRCEILEIDLERLQ